MKNVCYRKCLQIKNWKCTAIITPGSKSDIQSVLSMTCLHHFLCCYAQQERGDTDMGGPVIWYRECMNICVRMRLREHKHVREHLTTSPRLLGWAASSGGYHRTWQTNKRRSFIAQISSALMVTQMSDRRTACLSSCASMWRCWEKENILTMICSSRESIATMLSKYVL